MSSNFFRISLFGIVIRIWSTLISTILQKLTDSTEITEIRNDSFVCVYNIVMKQF